MKLFERSAGLLLIQLDQLAERCGVLGPLVSVAKADHPRKAQGIAGGVVRRFRDLVGQHLEHDLRLDPHAWSDRRTHAGGALLRSKRRSSFADFPPLLVAETRADLRDGHELVGIFVVYADEQGTHAKLGTLSAAEEIAEHDAV